MNPGHQLRSMREKLGLTLRDVESASTAIALKHENPEYALPLSRLSDIETKCVVPSIFRLYSLAVIYKRLMQELLSWYGVDWNQAASDLLLLQPPNSHRNEALSGVTEARIPLKLDPGFDFKRTSNIGRMVERWGQAPMAYLDSLAGKDYTYVNLGTEDFTMYPLLLPGSFLQIDESKNKVVMGMWHSEYERPIYLIEMRDGFTCCWCSIQGNAVTLQPHPLSQVPVRILRYPQEAEVVGQVVGVAMRLDSWHGYPRVKAQGSPLLPS